MTDLLLLPDFLEASTCTSILEELRGASELPATTYGAGPDLSRRIQPEVRRTKRVDPPAATRELVETRLRRRLETVAQYFGVDIREHEEPQFLRYDEGDFFVAHQDGNTGLLRADELNPRRISAVIFLSEPASYGGGELVFHRSFSDRVPLTPPAGTLVAFRAESTHEVTRVTRGVRYTIATFYR